MERDVAGGGGEIPVIVTAAVALTSLAALIAGRLLALHHEAAAKPVHGHQFVVGALLDDLTVIDHEYPVGIAHGFQPVDDHVLSWVNSATASISSFSFSGSTLAVSSSRMMMGASFMMARAMDMVKDSFLNGIWLNVAEPVLTEQQRFALRFQRQQDFF